MTAKQVIFLSLLAATILAFATSWYSKNLLKPLSTADLPEFEMPEFDPFSSQETKDYTEFISPDGKLKLKYPSQWMKMTPDTLEKINQALVNEKAENLLFVQGIKIETGGFVFLMIQKLTLEEEKTLEEIIETIKEGVEEQGGKVEISNLKIEDKIAYFEGKFEGENPPPLYLKEKIVFLENKAYLISLFNLKNDWSEFEKEVDEILNSVQIVN